MKIGLDITGALGGGGYRRYAEEIIRALAAEAPEHEFYLCGAFFRGFPERAEILRIPQALNIRWALRRFPQGLLFPVEEWLGLNVQQKLMSRLGLDLFHGLGSILPRLRGVPSVVTLHYSGPWPFRTLWERLYFNRLTRRAVRDAARVIAISEFCKNEAVREWGVPEEKFSVVWHGGPDASFHPVPFEAEPAPGVRRPYFLFVGSTVPQKNPRLLAEAFRIAKTKRRLAHALVFAGKSGPEEPWLRQRFLEWGLRNDCRFLGAVDPERIHRLYQQADAVVCPSLQEGFAIPTLEAMACGAPVIAAKAGALPEVVGDAGLLAEPDPESMAEAMIAVAEDADGCAARLKKAGLERVKMFSWKESARKTLRAYQEALKA